MAKVKFVTEGGEEFTKNEMIQHLMKRVSELEGDVRETSQMVDLLLARLAYLENGGGSGD